MRTVLNLVEPLDHAILAQILSQLLVKRQPNDIVILGQCSPKPLIKLCHRNTRALIEHAPVFRAVKHILLFCVRG